MTEFVQLVSQIVILATAVLGFYKVYRIVGQQVSRSSSLEETEEGAPEDGKTSGDPLGVAEIYGGLLKTIGVVSFILVVPAVLIGFTWLLNTYQKVSMSFSDSGAKPAFVIEKGLSKTEIALIAAMEIGNNKERSKALETVVTLAIENGEFEIATQAAEAIGDNRARTAQLKRVVDEIQEAEKRDQLLESDRDAGAD